ncbi:T9SS type A sorting domain-containing protein [bacterium]|nr:T9SS type A sorting domain-containing protein [bacterium]
MIILQVHCEEYTWIDGNTYTASNNTATFTLTNAAGCDSIVTLDLTIDICGCTDVTACNFDPTATSDDGSCTYETPIDLGTDITVCQNSYVLDAGSGYDTYLWSTGDTTQTITVSQTGIYSVSTPCSNADTISVTLNYCDSLVVNIIQNDLCNSNGIIEVIPPFTLSSPYSIDVTYPNGSVLTDIFTTEVYALSGLSGGLYEFMVYSGNDTAIANINLPEVELTTNFFSPIYGGYNVSCYGACDAELFINLINPADTYTLEWYNDSVSGTPFFTSTDVSSSQNNLCAGEYAILFTSSTGCESVRMFTIREPDSLYFVGTTGETLCDLDPNGFIEVDVFGGVGNVINNSTGAVISFVDYTFSWVGPDGYTSSQEDINSLEPGNYTLTVEDNNGCTYTDDFIVVDTVQGLELISINAIGPTCNGDSDGSLEVGAAGGQAPYEYRIDGGAWQSSGAFSSLSAGNYTLEVRDANDCIASLEVEIEITEVLTSETTVESCISYIWNGVDYTSSGTYVFLTQNANGCDSTATLYLTISQSVSATDIQEHCEEYTWIDGITYTESNDSAVFTLVNVNGCDSIITLDLTIVPSTSSDTIITSCDSYVWNQTELTQSGDYSFITTGSNGCDSIANLSLTIYQSNLIVDVQEHCYEYTWIDGITYTESNTSATYTYTNVFGCDSTIALDLTIHQSSISVDDVVSCNSYFWNGITYTESGTYTLNTTNVHGCDSTAILNLEIIEALSSSVTTVSACNNYTWNGTTYFESGLYMLVVPGLTGCDSISSLLLTINTPTSSEENVIACDEYEWNGQIYTQSGVYEFDTVDQYGCDSLAVLNLDICDLDDLSITGSDEAQTETIESYSVQFNPTSTYQWSVSNLGTIVSGQGTNTISVEWSTIEGLSTICVSETNLCPEITCLGDTICIDIEVAKAVGVNEFSFDNISIYPNPLTNESKVEFSNPNNEDIYISILDSRGRVVRTYDKIKTDNLIIKKGNLSNGLYYIELKGNSIITRETILIN